MRRLHARVGARDSRRVAHGSPRASFPGLIIRPVLPSLLAVLLLLPGPGPASGQTLGVSGSSLLDMRDDMPGGSGIHGWLSADLASLLRVGVRAGWDRGEARGPELTCSAYWPEAVDCVQEPVVRRNSVVGGSVAVQILLPSLFGIRLGIGPVASIHRFRVKRVGEETGREERPVLAPGGDRPSGGGWVVSADAPQLPGLPLRVRATLERVTVDFESCAQDAWSVCGEESLTRLSLGVGVPLRR